MSLVPKVYSARGVHVLADLQGADPIKLADSSFLQEQASIAARLAGATILRSDVHAFGPGQGVAGVVLLAESHLTFHTWPEHGFAAIDAFMCGECKPDVAVAHLVEALGSTKASIRTVNRGI